MEREDWYDKWFDDFDSEDATYLWHSDPSKQPSQELSIQEPSPMQEGRVTDYTDLKSWKSGIDLAVTIYKVTGDFPEEEQFGLTLQLRRAAVSVPSTIADGNARHKTGDYLRALATARGSLGEMKTLMIIAEQLGFTDPQSADTTVAEIATVNRQVNALYDAIERSQ